jgi:hypothetical protein
MSDAAAAAGRAATPRAAAPRGYPAPPARGGRPGGPTGADSLRRARSQIGNEALDRDLKASVYAGPGAQTLDQQQIRLPWLCGEAGERRTETGAHPLSPLALAGTGPQHISAQTLDGPFVGSEEAPVLAVELTVEVALGDSSSAGDRGNGRSVVTVLVERVGDRGQQPLPLVLRDELPREAVTATWKWAHAVLKSASAKRFLPADPAARIGYSAMPAPR